VSHPVVRFGAGALADLPAVLDEVEARRPLLVTSERWADRAGVAPFAAAYTGVRPHAPVETVAAAIAAAEGSDADSVVGLGG